MGTELLLSNSANQTDPPLRLSMYDFFSWPIDDTSASTSILLAMLDAVHKQTKKSAAPVVFADADGAGRVGTAIAIEHALYQAETKKMVDVMNIVATIREDRGGLVLTVDDYMFVHKVVTMYSLAVGVAPAPPGYVKAPTDSSPPAFDSDGSDDNSDALARALDNEH